MPYKAAYVRPMYDAYLYVCWEKEIIALSEFGLGTGYN